MTALRRAVLPYDGGLDRTMRAEVRGGKGMSLAEMTALGLRIPPGFTIATGVSRAYRQHGRLPGRVLTQVERELRKLESATGRRLGGDRDPLLLSVRSGAEVSMPGMMDTLLNVGLNTEAYIALTEGDERFADELDRRLSTQWKALIGGSVPEDPFQQIMQSIEAVLRSWESERARSYRERNGISHEMGTAVTVQQMVFGNMDQRSCTGVVFSADPSSGDETLCGEFLVQAQGEDVVSGANLTRPIIELRRWDEGVMTELQAVLAKLESHFQHPVDVEFTVESGVLYVLQARAVKFSPTARIVRAVRSVEATTPARRRAAAKAEVLLTVPPSLVDKALQPKVAETTVPPLSYGLSVSGGAVTGIVVRDTEEAERLAAAGESVILVRPTTSPEDVPAMQVSAAIVTESGGPVCHAAIIARELAIPAVVGVSYISRLASGRTVTVDGASGCVYPGTLPLVVPPPSREVRLMRTWLQGTYEPRVGTEWVSARKEASALLADFYLTELMMRLSRSSSLEIKATTLRNETHRKVAEGVAMYLLLATAAESRHVWAMAQSVTVKERALCVDRHFGTVKAHGLGGDGRKHVMDRVWSFARYQVSSALARVVGHVAFLFEYARWHDSYGGAPWWKITECLLGFLEGRLSPTKFVDQTFDLRHHGGALFDKHPMIRESYDLRGLLDLKRDSVSIETFYVAVRQYASREVRGMYQAGVKADLWK
ncbi:MAG TPA: PEP/pyruvate-binding domain-containing protein [Candidatus Saccharimonadales bacterium]|nr:PEP/pyruvate-binding domain-containing protein [Candidatus Saccharimonadales bacterium]